MEESSTIEPAGRKPARPLVVTLLVILVLSITVLYTLRLYQALLLWGFLATLPGVSPLYLALSGALWMGIGVLVILGLWTGNSLAPRATRIATLFFVIYNWLERWWWLSNRNAGTVFTPFAVGLSLLCLAFVLWALWTPEARAYFGDRYE